VIKVMNQKIMLMAGK